MRIIHTSDWHLGQNFMGKSRAPEHLAFFDWLLKQIEKYQVDAVIVAGDIFDTGSPPSYAREMYNRFVVDIQDTGCKLILLGGNHDSVATLNESKELLACLNTTLISSVTRHLEKQVIILNDRQGQAGAIVCAVPFIRQRDVLISQAGQTGKEKQLAMQQAIAGHYQTLYQRALKLQKKLVKQQKKAIPIIATGHLTTVGASTSESVRDIYIGTLDAFLASEFPPVDYMALGHIHKSQKVAKSEHIRYSGSPIALSFDETKAKKKKSVLLVDFADGKFVQTQTLAVPCFQAMRRIKGDLENLEKQLSNMINDYEFKEGQTLWLEVLVSSQDYLNDLQTRIQQMTEGLPVEVLLLRRERKNKQASLQKKEKETLNELSVDDVFMRRLEEESWETDTDKERSKRLTSSFKQVVNELNEENQS